jgi:predicted nucleotidyltransferase
MTVQEVLARIKENGFPYSDRLIHLFIGGSGLHGGRIEGKHDDDFYGVYVEPPNMVVGLREYPHYVWSSSGDHERNQPGDLDICLYSLRKWVKLAATGNPTALSFVFAPSLLNHPLWTHIKESTSLLTAKVHSKAFEGFAKDQLDRVLGLRGRGKHGQRPELEEKFGYDVKAAMHVIRLLGEGIELVQDGKLTYPRPEKKLLIDIRSGKYTQVEIERMAGVLFSRLSDFTLVSTLPESVNMDAASELVTRAYLSYWGFPVAEVDVPRFKR